MLRKGALYLAGLLTGLLSSGLLLLLAAGPRGRPIELHPPPTPSPIQVHVAGAVRSPGVYSLPHDSIVENAIAAAGGLSEAADPDAINLAQPVAAGERVYVPPEQGNLEVDGDEGPHTDPANGGLIPINRALEPELEDLPGIGPSLAAAIVKYRDQHGPFASIDALRSVPGIGPAKLEAIRDLISID